MSTLNKGRVLLAIVLSMIFAKGNRKEQSKCNEYLRWKRKRKTKAKVL